MPMSWNQETDARLLIAIITTTPSINWEAAAAFLGPKCTVSALKHRVARLKDKAGLQGNPHTKTRKPAKRAAPMKASKEDLEKAKAKAKSNKKAKVSHSIEEDNFDDVGSSDKEESSADDSSLDYV